MPRPRKEARLRLRRDGDRRIWIIKDGSSYIRTGCAEDDVAGAETRLAGYLASKYEPPRSKNSDDITCADVLLYYVQHRVPQLAGKANETDFISQLDPFWSLKTLAEVSAETSREYATKRAEDGVRHTTARRELETLRAAINYYIKERKLQFRVIIEMPPKGSPRERWLTRSEVARFIVAARKRNKCSHLARVILIGVYTGTRTGAILRMRWVPSIDSGWFDLDNGVMYRRGQSETATNKRRPSIRIPDRLLPHLKRWKKADSGCAHVVHHNGDPVKTVKSAWRGSRAAAGLAPDVIPHTLRHTCATWGMQNIQNSHDLPVLAEYLGMSLKLLIEVYGHNNPEHQRSAINAISRRPGGR